MNRPMINTESQKDTALAHLEDGSVFGCTEIITAVLTTPKGVIRALAGGPVEWIGRDLERLRGLIRIARGRESECPWCNCESGDPHDACIAFDENGEVR